MGCYSWLIQTGRHGTAGIRFFEGGHSVHLLDQFYKVVHVTCSPLRAVDPGSIEPDHGDVLAHKFGAQSFKEGCQLRIFFYSHQSLT